MTIGKVAKIVTRINPTSNNIIRWIKFYFIWSNSPRIREIYETENFSNLIAKRNQLLEENPPAKNVNSELKRAKISQTSTDCLYDFSKETKFGKNYLRYISGVVAVHYPRITRTVEPKFSMICRVQFKYINSMT